MTRAEDPESAKAPLSFRAGVTLALVVSSAVVLIATLQETALGQREVVQADAAMAALDWPDAIQHAKAAAEALAPLSPWCERGEQQLQAIGHAAETRGDAATAFHAYGALRTVALATTYPGSTHAHIRAEAEAALARVASWAAVSTNERLTRPTSEPTLNETAASMRDGLARDTMPEPGAFAALSASAFALLGAICWLGLGKPSGRGTRIAQTVIAAAAVTYGAVWLTH